MNVDIASAMQGIGDLRSQINPELCDSVRQSMSRLSKPGAIRRAEFDLNEFLVELADIDFDDYSVSDVAALLQQVGASLNTGLWVTDHE